MMFLREINGRQHYQIFTDPGDSVPENISRSTKGKFLGQHDPELELNPVQFVCCKPLGELLTTQTLKWCNKKKHQPRASGARPVLPPCTSRGSNPGHPAPQMHFYEAPQRFILCCCMPKARIKQGFKGIQRTIWHQIKRSGNL